MRCPFCAEDVRDDAWVCRHCGGDLKIPEPLISENEELKKHVAALQHELKELQGKIARRPRRSSSPAA